MKEEDVIELNAIWGGNKVKDIVNIFSYNKLLTIKSNKFNTKLIAGPHNFITNSNFMITKRFMGTA